MIALRELLTQKPTLLPSIDFARRAARVHYGDTVANLIEWETGERHDRLYCCLRHGNDSITIFYDHKAVWTNVFVSQTCPAEAACPLGYEIATHTNLLHALDGGETSEPHCPVHAPEDTY